MGNRLTILKMGKFRKKNNIKMGRCMGNILAILKMGRFRENYNLKMGLQQKWMFIMTSKEIKLQNVQLKMDHCIKERQLITMLMDLFLQDINLKMGKNMGNKLTILKMGRFREKNNM